MRQNLIEKVLREHIEERNAFFVFPTQTAADLWADRATFVTSVTAYSRRFSKARRKTSSATRKCAAGFLQKQSPPSSISSTETQRLQRIFCKFLILTINTGLVYAVSPLSACFSGTPSEVFDGIL